jgi:hypothetical protein
MMFCTHWGLDEIAASGMSGAASMSRCRLSRIDNRMSTALFRDCAGAGAGGGFCPPFFISISLLLEPRSI